MQAMKDIMPKEGIWSGFAISKNEMPYVAQTVVMGGNPRVGLEDNLYLSKGKLATNPQLVEKAIKTKKIVFRPSQKAPGIHVNRKIFTGGNHPPRNKIAHKTLMKIIFAYSPKKNKANPIDEYSTLYPATNSASASGKSKGARFVSAKQEIKNRTSRGNKGKPNQTYFCAKTIEDKFNDPTHKRTVIKNEA